MIYHRTFDEDSESPVPPLTQPRAPPTTPFDEDVPIAALIIERRAALQTEPHINDFDEPDFIVLDEPDLDDDMIISPIVDDDAVPDLVDDDDDDDFDFPALPDLNLSALADDAFVMEWADQGNEQLEGTEHLELRAHWGLKSKDWVAFGKTFPSIGKYEKEIVRYLSYHEAQEKCREQDLLDNMKAYFDEMYYLKDRSEAEAAADPTRLALSSPTLRSIHSILLKFWRYTKRGNLKIQTPLILDTLTSWDKAHALTQAGTFSKEEMGKHCTYLMHYMCIILTTSIYLSSPCSPQSLSTSCSTPPRSCSARPTPPSP
jgi:hypothetical protein